MKEKNEARLNKFLDKSIDILYNIIIKNSNIRSDKTMATANYTEQQTKEMVAQYEAAPTKETVVAIAEKLGKNTRSVIAKLSREGVYKAQPRTTKRGEPVVLKQELVNIIQEHFGDEFPSLVKASKVDLQKLIDKIS
jgi:N-methylhydantoinase B/oxoprolinase/acetone carboxylase alpha subunit